MHAVVLTIHSILVLALVGVVLLQRSEGGAAGMLGGGGGGAGGGFMSGRGAANVLTRTTTVLAALFFTTSMVLALMADRGITQEDVVRSLTGEDASTGQEQTPGLGEDDIMDILGNDPSATTIEGAEPVEVPVLAPETAEDEIVEEETPQND